MNEIQNAPSSCRSCAFLVKCFGQNDFDPVRTTVLPNEWNSFPLVLAGDATRVLSTGMSGPPIVFIHGPAGSADRWAFNLHSFSRSGYRALAIDLPGHGLASKRSIGPFSISGYARIVAAFLERLEEPVILVGASTGAHIAAYCANENQSRTKALVLVSGGGAIPLGAEQRERLRRIAVYKSRAGGLERLRRSFFDSRLAAGDIVEQEFRMNSSPGASEYLDNLGRYIEENMDDELLGPALHELAKSTPVLFVWGVDDRVLPLSFGQKSQEFVGGLSRFIAIENAGHAPYFERPGEFNQAVLEFLRPRPRLPKFETTN
jgi:2-hydroxy-6-oxonona-2,4-dienedioate hydrolase